MYAVVHRDRLAQGLEDHQHQRPGQLFGTVALGWLGEELRLILIRVVYVGFLYDRESLLTTGK